MLLTKINDKNADNSEKYKLGAREEGRELLQEYQELPINKVKTVSLNDVKEINGKTKLKNGKRTGVWYEFYSAFIKLEILNNLNKKFSMFHEEK